MLHWLQEHESLLWVIAVASLGIFIASILVMPAIVVRIPADYFAHRRRPPSRWAKQAAIVRLGLLIGKNLLGVVLLVAGLAMLALPGQGLLTILVGVLLIDFPRKYQFEKWLVSRSVISRTINWLRRRGHRPPLQQPVR